MLGLGETTEELFETLADLRAVGCDLLTLGQYLQPLGTSGRTCPRSVALPSPARTEFDETRDRPGAVALASLACDRGRQRSPRSSTGRSPATTPTRWSDGTIDRRGRRPIDRRGRSTTSPGTPRACGCVVPRARVSLSSCSRAAGLRQRAVIGRWVASKRLLCWRRPVGRPSGGAPLHEQKVRRRCPARGRDREFLGTPLLILLGDGVVASVVLLDKQADWIVITTGWALAVTLGVYVSGRLSGGHLNPAVTLALATRGRGPLGSRCSRTGRPSSPGPSSGRCLVYADYAAAFAAFEQTHDIIRGADGRRQARRPGGGGAGVFATYPGFDGLAGNLFSEFLGTAVLLFGVRAVDRPPQRVARGEPRAVLVGAVVWAIGLSLGGLTGYAINPARDLGPGWRRPSWAGDRPSSARTAATSGSRSSAPWSAGSVGALPLRPGDPSPSAPRRRAEPPGRLSP